MKKSLFICTTVIVLLSFLAVSVFAYSTVKLFVNGQEIESDVAPSIVNGRVLVPLGVISESLGATAIWNEETKSVHIDSKEVDDEKSRILLLESALAQKAPLAAAKMWAEGVKSRNGALQYAIMSPELKDEYYSDFIKLNWSTGVSSPWIESYEIVEKHMADSDTYKFEVVFKYSDSTKSTYSKTEYVTVKSFDGSWLISSIEEGILPEKIELEYENIELKNISTGVDLSGLNKIEDRQFGKISGEGIVLSLYSDRNNNVNGVFEYDNCRYILNDLGYSHDIVSIKTFDLQVIFKSSESEIYLLGAVGSDILGYKYLFFDEAESKWFYYHNWGIPEIADINNDGSREVLMKFEGLHNNAPDVNILAFIQGRFSVSAINSEVYEKAMISKNSTTVSSQFRQENGEILVDIELYRENRISKTYCLKDNSLISLQEVTGQPELIVYENTQYGFSFSLPKSWKSYAVVTGEWEGLSIGNQAGDTVVENGPAINIRHPLWTSEKPRQDIPVMIFTLAQWDSLQKEEFHIGAAPVGPSELGRNSKYVFALPARYNYAFLTGSEEVERILESDPLEPLEITGSEIEETQTQVVKVYFTCSKEAPGGLYPVDRLVPANVDAMQAAIEEMLKGPSEEERARGYWSHFSEQTSGMLRSIKRSSDGETVIIDFADFSSMIDRKKIPSPTSFGGGGIMADITWTIFKQFPEVNSLCFSFEGDESAFWSWLTGQQREPEVFTRTDWEQV